MKKEEKKWRYLHGMIGIRRRGRIRNGKEARIVTGKDQGIRKEETKERRKEEK